MKLLTSLTINKVLPGLQIYEATTLGNHALSSRYLWGTHAAASKLLCPVFTIRTEERDAEPIYIVGAFARYLSYSGNLVEKYASVRDDFMDAIDEDMCVLVRDIQTVSREWMHYSADTTVKRVLVDIRGDLIDGVRNGKIDVYATIDDLPPDFY